VILQDVLLIAVAVSATLAVLVAFASQLVVIKEQPGRVVDFEPTGIERLGERDAQVG
jgi:hypothetical protein